MFRDDLNTVEDVKNLIRAEWKWNEVCVERGMVPNRAVDYAFANQQGIMSVIKGDLYEEVFDDQFTEEWINWRHKMLFGE